MTADWLDTDRFYRLPTTGGEVSFQVVLEHTDLWVVAERDLRQEVSDLVRELRGALKSHILLQPEFLTSLAPVEVPERAHPLVRDMAEAGQACNVGPMAAVAGAISQRVADSLAGMSPNILVENGGDTFLRSTRERVVGLLAVPGQGIRLGLRLRPEEFPLSLCSSSGRVGHSLSFGRSDIVAVRARSGALADAAATALANVLRSGRDMNAMLKRAQELPDIDGVFAQAAGRIGVWGEMELVAVEE